MRPVSPVDSDLADRVRRHLQAFRRLPGAPAAAGARAASVAVVLVTAAGRPAVLVVKRAARGRNAGQWALPGGRVDGGEDAVAAALRELAEETSLRADRASVAGLLDDFVTRSGFVITPVVVLAPSGSLRRDPAEIASIHPVPLARLEGEGVPRWSPQPGGEPLLQMPLRHDMVVHAPTGAILWQFREVALRGRELRVGGVAQPAWTAR